MQLCPIEGRVKSPSCPGQRRVIALAVLNSAEFSGQRGVKLSYVREGHCTCVPDIAQRRNSQ